MPRSVSLAAIRVFFVALLAFLLLTGCGPAAQAPTEKAPAAAADQPQYGGTARLFGISIPVHLDLIASSDASSNRGTAGIYERLVENDYADRVHWTVTGKMVPALAERWEMSSDGKNYIFFLRKGVKFHDGEEFTAADVLFTYNRVINEKTPLLTLLRDVVRLEAPDPYTVKITTRVASVDFLDGLAGNLAIQSKKAADKGVDFKKVAIGTGPFKLGSHDGQTQTVWVKNENYWQKGLPYFDRVEVIWPLDKSAMLAAFASGNIDTTSVLDAVDFQTVRKSVPNAQYLKDRYPSSSVAYLNIQHPVLCDARVRQAMQLAVDRHDLAKLISQGDLWLDCIFPVALGACPPNLEQLPGFRQPKEQDIAEAKRLLAEAEYPNGFEFKLLYSLNYTQSRPRVEPFVAYMARIGIKAIPDGRDTASVNAQDRQGAWDAHLTSGLNVNPSATLYARYHSKGVDNQHGVGSPALDKLLEQESQTFDAEERKKMLVEINRIILDNNWTITTAGSTQYIVTQPWLKGPMLMNDMTNSNFFSAPVMATAWLDQKVAPKR